MLDVKRLAMFHAVAEAGSFSEAALSLGYAQSVVSHHVAQLERELGVTLFERARRPVRMTPAGERLHDHTGAILGSIRAAETDMRALAGMESGLVRLGAFLSACASFVPAAMGAFATAHPEVEVRLEQQEPTAALPRLIAGDLDLVVARIEFGDEAGMDPRLESVPLGLDPYRVVVPPGHRLARRREIRIADLAKETFNAPRPMAGGGPYQRMLERVCSEAGFTPHVGYFVDDVTVARSLVAAGLCVALMPELTVPHPRPDVVVRPVRGEHPFRTVHAFRLKGRRAPGVAAMTRALQEAAKTVLPPVSAS